MSIYNQQSPEQQPNNVPERIVGRRLSVTDISARFVLTATDKEYNKAMAQVKLASGVPINSSVKVEATPIATSSHDMSNVVQFPIPNQTTSQQAQPVNNGEVVEMDQYRMAKDAQDKLREIYGRAA